MLDIQKIVGTLVIGLVLMPLVGNGSAVAHQSGDSVDTLEYNVDLTDVKNHYLTINVTVPVQGKTTELMMAVWTPGSYLVREYARHIDSMEVTAKGKSLKFEKTRKNRWLVQSDGIKSFNVKYRLYCNEMSVRTNWVGKQFAMINGAPSYITVPDRLDQPHLVQLTMPRSWTRSATSLRSTGDTPHTFIAEDFDELVDSPIVAGNVSVYPFTVGGVEHQLVNVGESGYWDGTQAATDLKKVVQAHQDMWGVVPYDRYLFLNMIVESGGGLEHNNSTILMTSRWTFRDKGRYKGWLSLASHEFFHTWNVRRLRPKSLVTYDYENEVYTDSLWIAEGITSYYQDLALVRAGLNSRSEFISKLSRSVEGVQRTRGRQLQSLKDASYDAWIKYYRPDENSSNTTISYYSKGAVVAFLLDAKIRKLTAGKKSLDDLMRKMFADFEASGFTTEDFRKTASAIAGQDLSEWFASAIDSTDELSYDDIEAIGLVVPNKKAEPKKETPKKAESKKETSKKAESKKETPKKAESKKETSKKAESKKETSKKAESKKETSKKAESKKETPKKAEPKKKGVKEKKASDSGKKSEAKDVQDKQGGDKDKKKADAENQKAPKKKRPKKKKADDAKPDATAAAKAKTTEESAKSSKPRVSISERLSSLRGRIAGAMGSSSRFQGSPRPAGGGRPWLGFSSSLTDGKVIVSSVKPDSPASDVGLNNDDEIIAVEGFRITRSVDSRLPQYKVGDEIEILIARRGQLMTLTLTIGELRSQSWRIRLISKPSKEQKKQLDLWLGSVKK